MEDLTIKTSHNLPKLICGIDTFFYFCESNENYDNIFLDILDQIETHKGMFEKRDISYSNNDIKISINKQLFEYSGKKDGFYWMAHSENFLRIGFKDKMSNQRLNDIQVQFNAVGIYTLGIKALMRFADDLLSDVITGYKPITRADLNVFVQDNLSWLNKEMFVSRKRSYTSLFKEVSSKYRLQTIYVGKEPFKLRLYDKKEELKTSKKNELMYEYFANNGFEVEGEIFNIEFEMHREYIKTFNIDTVEQFLERSEALFKDSMDAIRVIDISTISEGSIHNKNRYKGETHPIWKYISDSYKLDQFLALDLPLERIKRKNYAYTVVEAMRDHVELAKKFRIHGGVVDIMFYKDVLSAFRKMMTPQDDQESQVLKAIQNRRADQNIITNSDQREFIITYEHIFDDGLDITDLLDEDLIQYERNLEKAMLDPSLDLKILLQKKASLEHEKKIRNIYSDEDYGF